MAAQPDDVEGQPTSEAVAANKILVEAGQGELQIVRRYCRHPSPLVRDGLSGWRTGRLDTVLAGDFDLFE